MGKKTKFSIFIIILLVITYFVYTKYINKEDETVLNDINREVIKIVEKKVFSSNLELNGTTKIKNEQKLRFNTTGKVTKINFEVGSSVKKGQTLAEIDSSVAINEIEKVQINLSNSKVKLKNFLDNVNDNLLENSRLNILVKESQIKQKNIELAYIKEKQIKELEQKEILLNEAVSNYKILEQEIKKNISNLNLTPEDKEKILKDKKLELSKQKVNYNKFKNTFDDLLNKKINKYYLVLEQNYFLLETTIIDLDKRLKELDRILGIGNDKFEYYDYFSAKDVSNKTKAKDYLSLSKSNFKDLKLAFKNIKSRKDLNNIIISLEKLKAFNENYYISLNYIANGFENSIETLGFSSGEISGYSSQYSSLASSINTQITNANGIIDELKNMDNEEKIKADLQDELETSFNNIEMLELEIKKIIENQDFIVDTVVYNKEVQNLKLKIAKNNLEQQVMELNKLKKDQIEILNQEEINVKKNQLELNDLLKKKEEYANLNDNQEYTFLKNEIKENEVNLKDAYKKLEDYNIQMPFDGMITKIDIHPGDRLNADTQKYISVLDPNIIEVKTFINQSDIIKVKQSMLVNMTLGAYPEKTFTGIINEIETTPVEENGISKFESKIVLNNPENLKLYSGMKALIKINLETIPECIAIPFISVEGDIDGKKFVMVKNNDKKEKRFIEVGYTDGEYYQVIKGLEEGEKVLLIDYDSNEFKGDEFSQEGF